MGIKVISAFDGMSCGYLALRRLGIPIEKYVSFEIDKPAMQLSKANCENIIYMGDIRDTNFQNLLGADLLLGGSPCQSFSMAGKLNGMSTKDSIEVLSLDQYLDLKEKGFEFEGQSYLFWEYVRVLREAKPKYFLLENVHMHKKWEDVISKELGVSPIKINSDSVSAQSRKRNYWSNIPDIQMPEDRGILLKDILEDLPDCPIGIAVREKSKCVRVGGRSSPFGMITS